MTADVNVTEKVAQALCPSLWDDTYPEHLREGLRRLVREQATAALTVLSDPEVLAGIGAALSAELAEAKAEVERLRAFAEGVLALHRRNRPEDGVCAGWTPGVPSEYRYLDDWCVECRGRNGHEYGTTWPCRTAALAEHLEVPMTEREGGEE